MCAYGTRVIDPDPGVRGQVTMTCIFASSAATHNTTRQVLSLLIKKSNPSFLYDVGEKNLNEMLEG